MPTQLSSKMNPNRYQSQDSELIRLKKENEKLKKQLEESRKRQIEQLKNLLGTFNR